MASNERRNGAGALASGVLERITPHEPPPADDGADGPPDGSGKGKGAARKTSKKVKGRTIYLPETLFERIMVQAHRKHKTISEYVTAILEREVPDYRTAAPTPTNPTDAEPA